LTFENVADTMLVPCSLPRIPKEKTPNAVEGKVFPDRFPAAFRRQKFLSRVPKRDTDSPIVCDKVAQIPAEIPEDPENRTNRQIIAIENVTEPKVRII